jgi:hypothetical protein
MKLCINLVIATLVGNAASFAPIQSGVRKVSLTLSMASDDEGPVLNKYSR